MRFRPIASLLAGLSRARRTAMRIAVWIRPPPQAALLQIVSGFWLSRAVFLAARIELADAIGDGPTALTKAAEKTGSDPEMLRRLLRALTGHGIFKQVGLDSYGPTELSDLLRSRHPQRMRGFMEAVLGHEHYEAWGEIEHALRTGGTAFEHRFGTSLFRYYAEHPDAERRFAGAMEEVTTATDRLIIPELPIGAVELAVDVGGGNGAFLKSLLARQPDARGISYDLPGVAEDAERRRCGRSSGPRLQFIAGDFFASVPRGADLYLLKMVLHDWTDGDAIRILRNIRTAVAPHGRLLVIEMIVPEGNQRHPATLADLNMMVMTGGRERNREEFRRILECADFRLLRTIPTLSPFSILEAAPAGSTGL